MEEVHALNNNLSQEKVWVFAHFNVPEEDQKIDSFYYYGRISKSLYNAIKLNKIKQGFILLDDVMYWGNDDLIHEYADDELEGELVFRIEDIKRIKLVNKKPGTEEDAEQAEEEEKAVTN